MPERGAFGVGESCYRYSQKLGGRNAEIADLLIALTNAWKTWRFGLCFLYLRTVQVIASHRSSYTFATFKGASGTTNASTRFIANWS
jgi:hypothetical protein